MNILAVDDEWMALELLTVAIIKYDVNNEVHIFQKPLEALEFAKDNKCEIAFLDLQMPGMTGIELARELKNLNPGIRIIFTTGYSEYAVEAFHLHATGYLLKPITPEKVRKEMEYIATLENSFVREEKPKKLEIKCFGNFEVFIDGEVMQFKYAKTKELLAYLVDRKGRSCSNREIMSALWEDSGHESYFRNIKKDLMDTMEKKGFSDVINNSYGKLHIDKNKISCDYYNWIQHPGSVNYYGEYMSQYSWAEMTNGWLMRQSL